MESNHTHKSMFKSYKQSGEEEEEEETCVNGIFYESTKVPNCILHTLINNINQNNNHTLSIPNLNSNYTIL